MGNRETHTTAPATRGKESRILSPFGLSLSLFLRGNNLPLVSRSRRRREEGAVAAKQDPLGP